MWQGIYLGQIGNIEGIYNRVPKYSKGDREKYTRDIREDEKETRITLSMLDKQNNNSIENE